MGEVLMGIKVLGSGRYRAWEATGWLGIEWLAWRGLSRRKVGEGESSRVGWGGSGSSAGLSRAHVSVGGGGEHERAWLGSRE